MKGHTTINGIDVEIHECPACGQYYADPILGEPIHLDHETLPT